MEISKRNLFKMAVLTASLSGVAACGNQQGKGGAEEYPSREITVLVPYGPGGGTDTITRTLAPILQAELGKKILVVNKPGGSGVLGISEAIKAKPDGYTLIMGAAAPIIAAPRFNDVGYAPTDLKPIARAVASPDCLVVTQNSPYASAEDFFAAVKSNKEVTVGVAGATGMQAIIINLINKELGSKISPVPFDSAADAIGAVRAGDVDSAMGTTLDVGPTVSAGDASLIAATDPERIPETLAKNVPSLADFGAKIPADSNWYGLMGPEGLDDAIGKLLQDSMKKALEDKSVKEKLSSIGAVPGYLDANAFGSSIEKQWEVYSSIEVTPAE